MSIETSKPGTDVERHPVPDPGLEEHVERYTDVDQAAGDRAYRQVVMMLAAVPVLCIAFVVIYFAVPRDSFIDLFGMQWNALNSLLGLTGGLATLLIGLACVQWAKPSWATKRSPKTGTAPSSSVEAPRGVRPRVRQGCRTVATRTPQADRRCPGRRAGPDRGARGGAVRRHGPVAHGRGA